jgi:hypothetical protein
MQEVVGRSRLVDDALHGLASVLHNHDEVLELLDAAHESRLQHDVLQEIPPRHGIAAAILNVILGAPVDFLEAGDAAVLACPPAPRTALAATQPEPPSVRRA